jgi:hypothetical protein
MALFQQNDRTNPEWVYNQLNPSQNPGWINACETRTKNFLGMYLNKQIDVGTLKFNLINIRGTKHEYSTYEENLRKNQLDDLINPLIESL